MKNNIQSCALCVLILMGLTSGVAQADLPEIQSRSNLSCMMGGIGADETEAMRLEAKKWPLNVEFTEQQGKVYPWVSGAQLQILNQTGKVIFNETCNGPLFLAKLTPGKYQLVATYEGVTKRKSVFIEEGKPSKVSFTWVKNG
jgi:hypothetical protein